MATPCCSLVGMVIATYPDGIGRYSDWDPSAWLGLATSLEVTAWPIGIGDQRDRAGDVLDLAEVHLGVVGRDRNRLQSQRAGVDRDPGRQVAGGHHDRLLGTGARLLCVESYEHEGNDHEQSEKDAQERERPS